IAANGSTRTKIDVNAMNENWRSSATNAALRANPAVFQPAPSIVDVSLGSLQRERFHHGNTLQETGRQVMPSLKIGRAIIGYTCIAVSILPNEKFQRKINRHSGCCQHERRSGLRISEDEKLRWPHRHSRLFGLSAVIDKRQKLDTGCLEKFLH